MLLDMKMEKSQSEINIATDSESESSEDDKYEADIEFSNACRHYYLSRLEATESFKKDLKKEDTVKKSISPKQRRRSTIDDKMETLRTEMASLMDQDVSLMKQLLTLNETINEIKQGRLSSSSKGSVSSRGFVSGSDWSVSEMSISPNDEPTSSKLTGYVPTHPNNSNNANIEKTRDMPSCKEDKKQISLTDLWKVRTQTSLTSNDSGYVEDPNNLLQTEV
ncbi:unnamed protein product [Mytilus edulis]|uniref:Uncharacterized protein n=1 Tax=Mytilus edulis TaxID=6550 RepID=A0A8S3RQT0_MYTED|nr:unnamed protein product [Mytilus edulis]